MKSSILKNARKLRGIYFIDPEDKEFKETIKNARKKLETPMAPAMPCKILKNNKNCGSGASNKVKSKLACILEASESTRLRMGESFPTHHEDHIARKGDNSLQHYNLVHKFIPMPHAMKIPAAKAAVDKEWEKLEKIPAWDKTRVRHKSEVIDEARKEGRKAITVLPPKDDRSDFAQEECPDIWIRLPRHKWPETWASMEDPVVPLERNLNGHPLAAGLLWERRLGKGFQLGMLVRTP